MSRRSVAKARQNDNASWLEAFAVHLATRPRHTREAYLRDVRTLVDAAGSRNVAKLARGDIARHLAQLHGSGLSGRSLARMLSAWRAFYRFVLERDRSLGEDPCEGLRAPKAARRLPSALTPDEAGQLVSLDLEGLDLARGEVRVLGKGGKERIVPVGSHARTALDRWIATRATHAAPDERALFIGQHGYRLTARAIERRLAEWAIKSGLGKHVHPHMLRHSFASHLLQSSGDLRAVQELLGHSSIASTQVYTHLDFQALAKVYDAAHPRAKRRKGTG